MKMLPMLASLDHNLSLALYRFTKQHATVRQVARVCASVLIWALAAMIVGSLTVTSALLGLPILVGAFFTGHIVNAIIEHFRWRERPYKTHHFEPLISQRWLHGSFPSDHAMMAAVLAAVWVGMGGAWPAPVIATALLVGLGRILVGVHYVSDIVVGLATGAAASLLFLLIF